MVLNSYNICAHYNSNTTASFICSKNIATALCRNVGSRSLISRKLASGVVKQRSVGL